MFRKLRDASIVIVAVTAVVVATFLLPRNILSTVFYYVVLPFMVAVSVFIFAFRRR